MHFAPTSSSWLNLVERFFADLTGDVIRAGSFASVNELIRDIKTFLAQSEALCLPRGRRGDPRQNQPRQRSTVQGSQPHEFLHGNCESGHWGPTESVGIAFRTWPIFFVSLER